MRAHHSEQTENGQPNPSGSYALYQQNQVHLQHQHQQHQQHQQQQEQQQHSPMILSHPTNLYPQVGLNTSYPASYPLSLPVQPQAHVLDYPNSFRSLPHELNPLNHLADTEPQIQRQQHQPETQPLTSNTSSESTTQKFKTEMTFMKCPYDCTGMFIGESSLSQHMLQSHIMNETMDLSAQLQRFQHLQPPQPPTPLPTPPEQNQQQIKREGFTWQDYKRAKPFYVGEPSFANMTSLMDHYQETHRYPPVTSTPDLFDNNTNNNTNNTNTTTNNNKNNNNNQL